MSLIFGAGDNIVLHIPIDDDGFESPIATASYSVYDMHNTAVIDYVALPMNEIISDGFERKVILNLPYTSAFDPSSMLDISPRAYFKIVVTFTTESNFVKRHTQEFYIEKTNADLNPPVNSFASFGYLMTLAMTRSNVECLLESTFDERLTAFIQAYRDLCTVPLFFPDPSIAKNADPVLLPLIESFKNDLNILPSAIRDDLALAQVVQATYILGGSPIEARRQWGLVSGTTGESTQAYRGAKPFVTPVCLEVYSLIKPYVYYTRRVGRG